MDARQRLSVGEKSKWMLALGIVLVYLPVRIYVSNNVFTCQIVLNKLPLWIIEWLVNVIFFRVWIGIIDYIQTLAGRIDKKIRFRFITQLATFFTGFFLAVLFNSVFVFMWVRMATFPHEALINFLAISENTTVFPPPVGN